MNRNTDNDRAPDPLDGLLASRPVRPSDGFADAALARIARERAAADPALDTLIASRPVAAAPGFADRVLEAVVAARRRRLIFRLVTPFAAAACVALALLPATGIRRGAPTPADRVAAALAADPELRALAALPSRSEIRTRDLAAFAELDAALTDSGTEYAYGI